MATARVAELVGEGRLTPVAKWAKAGLLRADVERRSLERWRPGDPTWLTTTEAAEVFGVTRARVSQLAERGFLPYEATPAGRRVFRPAQVEVIARGSPRAVPRQAGRLSPVAPWNATGRCTILDRERAVQVLHDGRWVDG